MSLVVSIVAVVVLTVFFVWLAVRAFRARRAAVKWPGMVGSGLLALVCLAVGGLATLGFYRLNVARANPVPGIQVAGSPEQLARGEHLANLCVSCHSSTGQLPLDGGTENFIVGIGELYAPNLTPGGPLARWSDGEIMRAIRQGVAQDGRALLIMPSESFRHLSDADVQALVAYLRSQPIMDHRTPESKMNLIGAVAVGAGVFPTNAQEPMSSPVEAPSRGPTAEYGHYLVEISGCQRCHGADLAGGTPGDFVPAGPNLLAIASRWSADEFVATMRTGVDPSGHSVDPEQMPWRELAAAYGDDELTAIYEYIRDLSPETESPK